MNPESEKPEDQNDLMSDQLLDQILASVNEEPDRQLRNRRLRWLKSLLKKTRPFASPFWARPAFALGLLGTVLLLGSLWLFNKPDVGLRDAEPTNVATNESESHKPKSSKRKTFAQQTRWISKTWKRFAWEVATTNRGLEVIEFWSDNLDWIDQSFSLKRDRSLRNAFQETIAWRNNLEKRLYQNIHQAQSNGLNPRILQQVQLLCKIGSKRSLPLVLEFLNIQTTQPAVVELAIKHGDSRLLGQLAISGPRAFQTTVLTSLLERGDRVSFNQWLQSTQKLDSFSAVQNSALNARTLPLQLLVSAIQSNRLQTSRIAGVALATSPDRTLTQELIRMAKSPSTSRAAIFVLVAKTDSDAQSFIELANRDLNYASIVRNATQHWNRLTTPTVSNYQSVQRSTP